jgi:hypothetical protein
MVLRFSSLTSAILMAVTIGAGTPAAAQTTSAPPGTPPRAGVAAGLTLAIPDLLERLSREGYSEVSEVKRKSEKLYKVGARNAQGRNVEIYVDARSAEVLASGDDD